MRKAILISMAGVLALAGSLAAAEKGKPEVAAVQSVYILPMVSGLDQYLAHHLTTQGIVQIVTDPQKADAVLTDRIGESFENRMSDLYASKTKEEKEKEKEKAEEAVTTGNDWVGEKPVIRLNSFSRGKGTIFLVDRKTGNVLWSDYVKPKNSTPNELDHVAARIASGLAKAKKVK